MSPSDYPLTTAWINSLPEAGLAAFPDCLCSTRLPMSIAETYPDLAEMPGLNFTWRQALQAPMEADGWIPETHAVLQQLILREAHFVDDATFFAATKVRVKASFLHPSIRPLMALMSPHLLILGARRRWATYHQGTVLSVTSKSARSLTGTLTFPPRLYPPLMVEDTRVAIESSIELTGKNIRSLTAEITSPGVCSIEGSWD